MLDTFGAIRGGADLAVKTLSLFFPDPAYPFLPSAAAQGLLSPVFARKIQFLYKMS